MTADLTKQRISEKTIQNTLKNREIGVLCLFSVWENLSYKYLSFIG